MGSGRRGAKKEGVVVVGEEARGRERVCKSAVHVEGGLRGVEVVIYNEGREEGAPEYPMDSISLLSICLNTTAMCVHVLSAIDEEITTDSQ